MPPDDRAAWLVSAADLLMRPDPGPTPWLVEHLIVDQAIAACAGRWKTTKSYCLMDVGISVVTGRPLFGEYAVPNPGPVVYICEESGLDAMHRRLDALARGRAVDVDELMNFHVAANARVRLDDPGWQNELIDVGKDIQPRLFILDPLARLKGPARDESAQKEMATVVEYIRDLRNETGAAVAFVHHLGHTGDHMRGSSDLESVWETRLAWSREPQSPLVTITAEHREAEPAEPVRYRIAWDSDTRSMRFNVVEADGAATLAETITDWLRKYDEGSTDEIAKALHKRRDAVKEALEELENRDTLGTGRGTVHRAPSDRLDGLGRPKVAKVWKLTESTPSQLRTEWDDQGESLPSPSHRPTSIEVGGTDGSPNGLPDDLGTASLEELSRRAEVGAI